jgi:hypothetical protein
MRASKNDEMLGSTSGNAGSLAMLIERHPFEI